MYIIRLGADRSGLLRAFSLCLETRPLASLKRVPRSLRTPIGLQMHPLMVSCSNVLICRLLSLLNSVFPLRIVTVLTQRRHQTTQFSVEANLTYQIHEARGRYRGFNHTTDEQGKRHTVEDVPCPALLTVNEAICLAFGARPGDMRAWGRHIVSNRLGHSRGSSTHSKAGDRRG